MKAGEWRMVAGAWGASSGWEFIPALSRGCSCFASAAAAVASCGRLLVGAVASHRLQQAAAAIPGA